MEKLSDKQLSVHEKFKLFIGQKVSNEKNTARALTWLVNKINLRHKEKPSLAVWTVLHEKSIQRKTHSSLKHS